MAGRSPGAEPPTPEQLERWLRRTTPPENELPAATGVSAVLGLTDDTAVGLTQVAAFTTGFRFTLAVRLRRMRPEVMGGGLFMLVGHHAPPGVEVPLADRLLLGLEYPDGRRASTVRDVRLEGPGAKLDPGQLILVGQGGGGGDLSVEQDYWVAPLPPDGPVTFVLSWPGFGIAESRTAVDGGLVRAAAARSRILWPPQPPPEPLPPPMAPRPSTGWFADPAD